MCGEGQGELSSVALVYMPFRMRKLRASGLRSGDVVAAVCFMFTIASSLLVVAHCIAYVRSGQAMRLICASSIKVSAIGKMEEAVPSAIIGNTTKFAAHPKGNSRAFESQPRTLPPTMAVRDQHRQLVGLVSCGVSSLHSSHRLLNYFSASFL